MGIRELEKVLQHRCNTTRAVLQKKKKKMCQTAHLR